MMHFSRLRHGSWRNPKAPRRDVSDEDQQPHGPPPPPPVGSYLLSQIAGADAGKGGKHRATAAEAQQGKG